MRASTKSKPADDDLENPEMGEDVEKDKGKYKINKLWKKIDKNIIYKAEDKM